MAAEEGQALEFLRQGDLQVVTWNGFVVGQHLGVVARPRGGVEGVDEVAADGFAAVLEGDRAAVVGDGRVPLFVFGDAHDHAVGLGQTAEERRYRGAGPFEGLAGLVLDLLARVEVQ